MQALVLGIAAFGGFKYIKKRAEERKFDLVVNAYKYSLKAYHVLKGLKQPPALFTNRQQVNDYQRIGNKQFAALVSRVANSYADNMKKEQSLFDNLYESYVEMKLFFSKKPEITEPIKNLLWSRARIAGLLENVITAGQQIDHTVVIFQDAWIEIIDDAIVQIWEDIELTDTQKNKEEDIEDEKGKKFVRKYYHLNTLLDQAIKDIEEQLPRLIKTR